MRPWPLADIDKDPAVHPLPEGKRTSPSRLLKCPLLTQSRHKRVFARETFSQPVAQALCADRGDSQELNDRLSKRTPGLPSAA
jgi:hypothetical protein